MSLQLIVVDDQTLVRQGIVQLLSLDSEFRVVAEACHGQQLLFALESLTPDVILLDLHMPVMDGLATLTQLRAMANPIPVLVLTTFDDVERISQAMQLGAKGYLLKDAPLETLQQAIRQLASGKSLWQPAMTDRCRPAHTQVMPAPIDPLTEKELTVLRLVAAGFSNREIAEAVFKSEGTIKNMVSVVLAKLGARDRTQAVLKAIEHGLLS